MSTIYTNFAIRQRIGIRKLATHRSLASYLVF